MMADYEASPNEDGSVLKKARKSAGGTLTSKAEPSALPNAIALLRARAADAYRRGDELFAAEPDMTQMQAYARDRGASGEGAMLNALAAQFAGDSFEPVQAQFLKRAAAAQEPLKMTGGVMTPDGKFIKDPQAMQEKRAEFLLKHGQALEGMASSAETKQEAAAARAEQNAIANQMRLMGLNLQQMSLGERIARQRSEADVKQENKLEEKTRLLSKQADPYVNLSSGVKSLNERLAPYLEAGKSIPGVGYGSDIGALGLDISGVFIGEEGKANRAAVKNVANELLRAASGQAVTLNEYQRQTLANMSSGKFSEKDFLNAYRDVVLPKVNEALSNIGGGYSPEVKKRYGEQGGKVDFEKPYALPGAKAPAKSSSKAPLGVEQKLWDAMSPEDKKLWQN